MDRYRITLTPDGRQFAILDRVQYEYCALPDDEGNLLPLEWPIRAAAEAWLQQCYRTWQTWEGNGAGRAPKGWRPHPPMVSPWDRGIQFYN